MVTVRRTSVRHALVTSLAFLAAVASAYAQTPEQHEPAAREQQFILFQNELRQAVRTGAASTLRGVRLEVPEAELGLGNQVEVEGFKLDEGAMLFKVRVPSMQPSLRFAAWLMLQEQARPRRNAGTGTSPTTVTPTNLTPTSTASPTNTTQIMPPPPRPYVDTDIDDFYTREVQTALIRTMLTKSGGLRIPPGQRLTIAARDDGRPNATLPSSYKEFNTLYFSIKGSDLIEFHENRLSLEQAEKLVTVRED
jgi:hypothetical protein